MTKVESYCKLRKLVQESSEYKYGGIAQLARARGSYPRCRWFKSSSRYFEKGLYKPFFFIFFKEQTDTGKLIIAKVTVVAARRVSGESSSVKIIDFDSVVKKHKVAKSIILRRNFH